MKLNRRDRKALEMALDYLQRGQSFVMNEQTLVCRTKRVATTTLDFQNEQGQACYSIAKDIGSDLVLLQTGIDMLKRALFPPVLDEAEQD